MEDANLLGEDLKALAEDLAEAEDRLKRHQVNERARIEAEIETDLERYLKGQEIKD